MRPSAHPDSPAVPTAAEADSEPANLSRIAHASVQLAALGPRLARVAAEMESQARGQARSALAVAETTAALVTELESAMAELGASSTRMDTALSTVKRIADHTRLLSINASIEAARAGASGRAFGVVVDEVKQLADNTGASTREIETQMEEMRANVARVSAVTGRSGATEAGRTVEAVNRQVGGMAASAQSQLAGAQSLHAMGGGIRTLTEELLLTVGKFRFEAHAQARRAVEGVLPGLAALEGAPAASEATLENWLREHPYFEYVYLTDGQGRQFTSNVGWSGGQVSKNSAPRGHDWSDRPWYRAARRSTGVIATDIYRSAATGDFCFTVAAAWRTSGDNIAGVIGADVNFQRLVLSRESLAAPPCLDPGLQPSPV
jgi:hypothetical protein